MELHGGDGQRAVSEAFVGSVVEVRHRRFEIARKRMRVDGVSVIVRRDQHVARDQILDRLIAATVTVRELVGARTARERKQLMAETDAEQRLASDQIAQRDDRLVQVGRIAGPRRDEDRVGIAFEQFFFGGVVRHDRHLTAERGQFAQDRAFDAAVDQRDARTAARAFDVALARRYAGDQSRGCRRAHEDRKLFFRPRDRRVADGERRPDRAVFAQRDGDRARVGAGHRGHVLLIQPSGQAFLAQIVRRMVRDLFDDGAGHARARILRGNARDAVVADQGIGEREELSGIGRIGQGFFVAGHSGVEDRFTEREALRSEAVAVEA